MSAEIKTYEENIVKFEAEKVEADKLVTRLKEAKENSEKLAAIAEEAAASKESTDEIV
jgi:hypothetical protein